MLHYEERKNRIHIITLDNVLAHDISERLKENPAANAAQIMLPALGRPYTTDDILKLARDTTDSRILIIDVRSQTRPMLQRAHSDIVRFNRPDLNKYCYTVLIGDGPAESLIHQKGAMAFQNYLSELRVDYTPAVFFINPFICYSKQELWELAMYKANALPEKLPQRLEKYFLPGIEIKKVYEFFKGSDPKKRKKRLEKLKSIYSEILEQNFPNDKDFLANGFTKQGCSFPGESLKLNVYPFYFEEWIADLLDSVQKSF